MADQQKSTPTGPKPTSGAQKLAPNLPAASPVVDTTGQSEAHKALSVRVDRIYRTMEAQAEEARNTKSDTDKQLAAITSALADITTIVKAAMPKEADGRSEVLVGDQSSAREVGGSGGQMPILSPQTRASSYPPSTSGEQLRLQPQVARKLHDLPSFSGAPEDWPRFYAMYKQSTEAYGYSALDNSIRLQRCLVGEAKNAVDCLMFDVEATSKVIEALRFRFGRPELLAQSQLRRVREIPAIPEAKAELIVPYASKVANMIACLNQPKTKQYLMNPELLEQLVQKLPMSRRHEWGRHAVNIEPCASVNDFSTWLDDLARCVSYMTPAATLASATQPQLQQLHYASKQQSSVAQSSARTRDRLMYVHQHDQQQCGWCDRSHSTEDCRRFAELNLNDRWQAVRSKNLCFSCLQRGHITSQCNPRSRCGQDGCDRSHHNMLHDSQTRRNNNRRSDDMQRVSEQNTNSRAVSRIQSPTRNSRRNPFDREQRSVEQPTSALNNDRVHNCLSNGSESRQVIFRILPVVLHSPNQRAERTFALLDEGSSVTMLDEAMADKLGLAGPKTTIDLQWVGGRCTSEASRIVSLRISGVENCHPQFELQNVRTVKNIDLPKQSLRISDLASSYERLRGLPIRGYQHAVPTILIGADNIHLGVAMRQISGATPGPVATKTRLGWVICGPRLVTPTNVTVLHAHVESHAVLEQIHEAVKEHFSLENLGVRHCELPLESRNDKRARDVMLRTTRRVGAGFEIGLLWRTELVNMPESRSMALNRLLSVERKMKREPIYATRYVQIIDDYIQNGYARRLSSAEAASSTARTWFLPHFAVFNPNKPAKMRVVFDAAAVSNDVSLNSVLLKGPDLTRPLLTVLHQFRMGVVGVCADIKDMFLRVQIRPSDTDAQRFLWRRGDESKPIEEYVMLSMLFGAACSPSAAQYVKNVNAEEYISEFPEAVQLIKNSHYVDDYVASFDSAEDAVRLTRQVAEIHRKGNFELRGYLSNNEYVLNEIDGGDGRGASMSMQLSETSEEKILGMYWDTNEDNFLFRLTFSRVAPEVVSGQRRPTKREMLSATMSIYDPFGLLANYTIYTKLLLQELWRHGSNWDEQIPPDIDRKWQQWVAKLDTCRQVRVPRCYQPNISGSRVELHVFADASQSAYAAVAYWRIEVAPADWRIVFVAGKARCAPQKVISVPRLELQAAILAVRLKCSIRAMHDIEIERTIFWSDSKTVIQWVRSDALLFKPFVAHRIAEIMEESTIADWRWIPTQHNAADDATRAKYPVRFEATNRWISGPDFLRLKETLWPAEPADMRCTMGTEEVRPLSVHHVSTILNLAPISVQITRFSNFSRACRAMAMVLRFAKNLRTSTRTNGELRPCELEDAERHLIRSAQWDEYEVEIKALRQENNVPRCSSIRALLPHLDRNGILRVTGRIDRAVCVPEDVRNPVILPRNHHLTKIIVAAYHCRLRHQQQAATVNEVRQKYWVPHLRALVRQVKSACMFCRIKSANAVEQVMGQLPDDRVTPYVRPFTYTGVDYFGPLLVTIGRRREKRWVALFTCMTTRAIHLELATNLSTDAFLICLRNFMNLRGVPKRIRSDNGTNFIGASRELKDAIDLLDHSAIQRELSVDRIEWVFNCPGNPEAGGCWERMVQSVKRVLDVTLREVAPQVDSLRSLLLEAANIINSRPLTHLPVHGEDDEPLTPNHFLLGTSSSTQTPGPDDVPHLCLRKQWRIVQSLKNRFWKRWICEYLPDLTRRAKGYREQPALTVGALVLICDALLPRGQWRRGRVLEVYPGVDGRVRTALIKTAGGELKRPVSRLAVLDLIE